MKCWTDFISIPYIFLFSYRMHPFGGTCTEIALGYCKANGSHLKGIKIFHKATFLMYYVKKTLRSRKQPLDNHQMRRKRIRQINITALLLVINAYGVWSTTESGSCSFSHSEEFSYKIFSGASVQMYRIHPKLYL